MQVALAASFQYCNLVVLSVGSLTGERKVGRRKRMCPLLPSLETNASDARGDGTGDVQLR